MLDPEYMRHVADGAEQIAGEIHEAALSAITEGILIRMKRGDAYRLTAKDKWMLETLQQAGYLREELARELAARTGLMLDEMREAFEAASVRSLAWDDEVYRAAGLEPTPLRQSPHLQRLVRRGYEATAGQWRNFTGTFADEGQRLFIRQCDRAYHMVSSGLMSHTQAISQAVEEAAKDGIVVRYPSGRRDTIETATRRAVLTGVGQACGDVTLARMEEMDWDIVLVSAHLGARTGDGGDNWTNHYWWQGKFYSRGNISVASLTRERREGMQTGGDAAKTETTARSREGLANGGESDIMKSAEAEPMGIDIEIDKFTPCLEDARTGEIVETTYSIASKEELAALRKKGWLFNWRHRSLKKSEIYKLTIKGDSEIQGLVAIEANPSNYAYHLSLVESAPHNRGREKAYNGVGGHLFAIAAQKSFDSGFGGFVYFEAKNMDLVRHYTNEFGAQLWGRPHQYSMIIDTPEAERLLRIYNSEEVS